MLSGEALLGHVIGDYQLKRIIGKGGVSMVFLGERTTSPQELVAVKVLLPPPSLSIDEIIECRRRFAREILTLRERLDHPSILPILASGEDPSTKYPYLVMPYVSGGNLAERLESGNLQQDKVPGYVMQIAEALDYAHSQQVIHRDLKPGNVLVDEGDHVYLVDFGIAKIFDSALTQISQPGQAIGTPEYMAPEQAMGAPVSNTTDIYGLAVMTYALVTGRLPFPSASMELMLMQVATIQPVPPRTFRSDLPEPAEAVLLRALNKDPKDRFATASEFAQALAQGLKGQWPQGLHSPGEASLQAESTATPPLIEPVAASTLNNEAQEMPAVPLVKVLDQASPLHADKKRSPVLVSRRMLFSGLASLTAVGGGVLWYLLNDPFAPVKKLQAITPSSTPGRAKRPAMNATLTPTTQPTAQPTHPSTNQPPPAQVVAPPLSVTIQNIPPQVMGGNTVPVVVTASQPGVPVALHVTYSALALATDSAPQITDFAGQTTFSWTPPMVGRHQPVSATVGVTASNNQGQNAQSDLIQVQVMPTVK